MAHISTPQVYFFLHKVSFPLKQRRKLKSFLNQLFRSEGKTLEYLNCILCSDSELRSINKKYLGHDSYTDVVSFDLSSRPNQVEGEVYISVKRVKENAASLKVPPAEELCRVLFHGALHLCGYKDKSPSDKKVMREKEEQSESRAKGGDCC